jgi:hypothetical protein
MREREFVSFMDMHFVAELDGDVLCRTTRNDWGKEFCFIFYLETTIRLSYVLRLHAQKYIGSMVSSKYTLSPMAYDCW